MGNSQLTDDQIKKLLIEGTPEEKREAVYSFLNERRVELLGVVRDFAIGEPKEELALLATKACMLLERAPPDQRLDREINRSLWEKGGLEKLTRKGWIYLAKRGKASLIIKALEKMGKVPPRESVEFIDFCLAHVNPVIRRKAIPLAMETYDPTVFAHMLTMLIDPDEGVCLAAVKVLHETPDHQISTLCERAVMSSDPEIPKLVAPFLPVLACVEMEEWLKPYGEGTKSTIVRPKAQRALNKIEEIKKSQEQKRKEEEKTRLQSLRNARKQREEEALAQGEKPPSTASSVAHPGLENSRPKPLSPSSSPLPPPSTPPQASPSLPPSSPQVISVPKLGDRTIPVNSGTSSSPLPSSVNVAFHQELPPKPLSSQKVTENAEGTPRPNAGDEACEVRAQNLAPLLHAEGERRATGRVPPIIEQLSKPSLKKSKFVIIDADEEGLNLSSDPEPPAPKSQINLKDSIVQKKDLPPKPPEVSSEKSKPGKKEDVEVKAVVKAEIHIPKPPVPEGKSPPKKSKFGMKEKEESDEDEMLAPTPPSDLPKVINEEIPPVAEKPDSSPLDLTGPSVLSEIMGTDAATPPKKPVSEPITVGGSAKIAPEEAHSSKPPSLEKSPNPEKQSTPPKPPSSAKSPAPEIQSTPPKPPSSAKPPATEIQSTPPKPPSPTKPPATETQSTPLKPPSSAKPPAPEIQSTPPKPPSSAKPPAPEIQSTPPKPPSSTKPPAPEIQSTPPKPPSPTKPPVPEIQSTPPKPLSPTKPPAPEIQSPPPKPPTPEKPPAPKPPSSPVAADPKPGAAADPKTVTFPKSSAATSVLSRFPSFIVGPMAKLYEPASPDEHLRNLQAAVNGLVGYLNFSFLQTYLFFCERNPRTDEVVSDCLKANLLGQNAVRFIHQFSLTIKNLTGNTSFFTFSLSRAFTEAGDENPLVPFRELYEFVCQPPDDYAENIEQAIAALPEMFITFKGMVFNRIIMRTQPGARVPYIDLSGPAAKPLDTDPPSMDLPPGEIIVLSRDGSEALGLFPFFTFSGQTVLRVVPSKEMMDSLLERLELPPLE